MHQYIVENLTGGAILGVFAGRNEAEALSAYARDAGYDHFDAMMAQVPVTEEIVATPIRSMSAGYWLRQANANAAETAALGPGLSEPVDPVNGPWAIVVDVDEGTPALAVAAEQDADPDMILLKGLPTDAAAGAWLPLVERATGLPPITAVRGG